MGIPHKDVEAILRNRPRHLAPVEVVKSPQPAPSKEPVMNKLETAYLERLQHNPAILRARFGVIRLRLADSCWYKPDFYIEYHDNHQELHETKGFMREAGRLRLRIAAELYPAFTFFLVRRERSGKWTITTVPGRRI